MSVLSQQQTDPLAVYNRFQQKQHRNEQFTEDIRKVVHGGVSSGANRTRSPGLRAGAALALGVPTTAAEAHADAHAACRQALEKARRGTCPFDDHRQFGVGGSNPPSVATPASGSDEMRAATQAAAALGKQNRDLQQKIGAPAPFDAPFDAPQLRERSAAISNPSTPAASPSRSRAFVDARTEALANQRRMKGSQDLIAGNYWGTESSAGSSGVRRNNSLPPRPDRGVAAAQDLMPAAHMKLTYQGGSVASLTRDKVEYLNSKVLAESNRDRNVSTLMKLG